MADLKTTNIYGDAYINNKVGINTNTPATRLQIGQLSPTAATEGIQFGDDTAARLHRINSGHIRATGGISSATFLIADNYLQTNNNLIYPSSQAATQRLEVGNAANNAWIDGITIAPGGNVNVYNNLSSVNGYVYAGTYLQSGNSTIYAAGYGNTLVLNVGNASGNNWINGIAIAQGGNVTIANNLTVNNNATVTNDLTVNGNTYLGNANNDTVFVNDTIRIGATDSGDASLFFGEGGVAGSDYGARWYWDSGYTFTWYTRNAGTDTALFDYVTNDATYLNWRRNFHMQNKEINYNAQIHFNAGTRFVGSSTQYLIFRSDATNAGGIIVQDGTVTIKGYTGYWDSNGGGILNNTGNWAVRYNFGSENSGGTLYGAWTVNGNISATNLSGTNTGDQTVGNGTITIAAGTGISVASNTFTTNQTGNSTVTVTNSGVTSLTGTANRVTVSAATGAVTLNLPQDIHTGASPTFAAVSATTFTGALSGNATTATSADNIDGRPFVNTNSNSATNADSINSNGISYYTGGVTNFSGNATDGGLYSQAYSNDWQHQIAGDYRSGQIALRGKNSGTWQSWRRVLDDTNSPYALNMNQYVRTTDSPTFAGLSLTSVSTTGATITNLTGAYQNTTVYDSPKTQSATPSRGIRAPASSIQFTDSYAIAPFWTYRSTGDWPVPYGIGWGTGGESSGIFQRYASNGSSFGDMIFYTGNDGSGAFSFRRHTWEGTTHFAAGSGELNTELFRIDWSGNLTMLGTLNGSANSATLYANNASYGSWRIGGTRNGWYGIEFESGTNLMANSNEVGFHRNGHGWQFWWSAGTGYVHKGNPGGGTQATILDSSNASNAWNMNQNVRTTDSPTFGTLQLTRLNFGATGATPYTSAAGEGTGNGITFGGDEAGPGYRIFTTMENVGGNYSKLVINWHTGIRIGAYTNYGGVRFYNNAFGAGNPTPSEIFSIGNTDSNVRVVNNLIVNGITLNQERSTNARIYGASAGSMGLLGVDSAAAFRWQIYGDSGNYGFLDSTWGNWDIKKAVNGELDLRVSSALVRVLNSGNASFAWNMNQNVRTTDNVTFGTVTAALSGNAATATTLQTARAINGVSFNGSAAITVNGLNYNVNNDWLRENGDDDQFKLYGNSRTMIYRTDGNTNAHGGGAFAHIFYYGGSADANRMFIINTDGRLWSPYHGWLDTMSISGNAATATTLQTARNINGTSFNGSAAITTATWGTARTITIGSTGKSVDGSANVSWTLAEIGAAATNQTMFIGTTSVAINRASAAISLAGTSIDGTAGGLNSSNYISRIGSSGNYNTDFQNTPAGTVRHQGDDANITNTPGGTWWFVDNYRHSNASNYWGTQVAWGWEDNANKLATRNITGNSFGGWVYYLNSVNYTDYTVTKTGTGASGTWGINITGNAATATTATNVTIANGSVTLAKIENITAYTILGNSNASAAATPAALSVATVATMLSGQTMNINGSSTSCSGTAANATTAGGLAVHTGTNNEANKIVRTQGNGYIMAGWINTISGDNGTTAIDRVYASSDGYIRYYTPANFRTVLDVPTRAGSGASGNWAINITGNAATATTATTAGALTTGNTYTIAGLTSNGTINIFPTYADSYSYFLRMGYDNSGNYDYTVKRNGTTGFLEFNGTQTNYVAYYFAVSGASGIGIGVSPAARLHINGDGTNPPIRIDNPALGSGASNSRSFHGWLPISIGGTTKYIQLYN